MKLKKLIVLCLFAISSTAFSQEDESIGSYSANPYNSDSTANEYGAGSPHNSNSINNPYGTYGSPYSNQSAKNPYATDAPRIYDQQGNYHGRLSSNPYDPDSTSNPYGRYGNPSLLTASTMSTGQEIHIPIAPQTIRMAKV